jgi:hypothetical protein
MRIMEGGEMKEICHSVSGEDLRDAAPATYGTPVRDPSRVSIKKTVALSPQANYTD